MFKYLLKRHTTFKSQSYCQLRNQIESQISYIEIELLKTHK